MNSAAVVNVGLVRRWLTGRGLFAGAAIVLFAGYLDLVRGGITLGPVLLVLGYCVLIPAAIWQGPSGIRARHVVGTAPRPSYGAAAVVASAVLLLYLATLAPGTAMWDASEYIAAAYTVGLPHPPGNPLFVLLGRVFALLPMPGGVAVRINVLAALASAVSAGIWFLVAERAVAAWLEARWQRILTGTLAAVIGATAFTVWHQSVVNEKVYTVSLAGLAIVSWLAVRWSDSADDPASDRFLVLIAYLCGLGYANHMAGMLPLPALALLVITRRPRVLRRVGLLAACAGAMTLGFTPFATQPIRAAHHPPINEGEPTACRDGLAWSCTFSRGTWDAFVYNINREQYAKPRLADRQAPFSAQVGMWWQYFNWQWWRDVHVEHPRLQSALAAAFLAFGLLGGWVHYRYSRRTFWYFGALILTTTVLLIYYLNFRYGASQAPELGDSVAREVRDRDYFFLWSFSAWGVWAALGLVLTWQSTAAWSGSPESRRSGVRALALSAPVLVIAVVPLFANWSSASRRTDDTALALAHDLLNSVEPYGVLVTFGDNDTFPLWYAQEVEGIRRDVTVAVLSLLNTDWFPRSIVRRPVHEYDATHGPSIYAGRTWARPAGSPLDLTISQVDSLPPYAVLKEAVTFRKGALTATIDPGTLPKVGPGTGLLERSDIIVLQMISDSWPERPIFFSRTTADYAFRLGLGSYLVGHGLARKLVPPDGISADALPVEGGGWLDVGRSASLWRDAFRGPRAIVRRGDWVDRPSISIPVTYILAGMELSEGLRIRGDTVQSAAVAAEVQRIGEAVRVGSPGPGGNLTR